MNEEARMQAAHSVKRIEDEAREKATKDPYASALAAQTKPAVLFFVTGVLLAGLMGALTVKERMPEKLKNDLVRNGRDVGAEQRCLNHVNRTADARR